jgi:hypothetical protein
VICHTRHHIASARSHLIDRNDEPDSTVLHTAKLRRGVAIASNSSTGRVQHDEDLIVRSAVLEYKGELRRKFLSLARCEVAIELQNEELRSQPQPNLAL